MVLVYLFGFGVKLKFAMRKSLRRQHVCSLSRCVVQPVSGVVFLSWYLADCLTIEGEIILFHSDGWMDGWMNGPT